MNDYELGYTPGNLRRILKEYNLTQKEVYELIGKSRGVFSKYILDVDDKNFVSMNHSDWLKIISYVKLK